MLKKKRSNDFRGQSWRGISASDVHLLLSQILSSPARLGPTTSCMLLHIKRYIVFIKFFTEHQTMEKPRLTARQVEAQAHFFSEQACKWETHVHQSL